jgi:hypothetical protein
LSAARRSWRCCCAGGNRRRLARAASCWCRASRASASRLAQTLFDQIAGEPHSRLLFFCSPHHQDSALYPFLVQLERAAGFARDDTPEAKLGKLRALIAEGAAEPGEIALIAELLALPNAAAELDLSPQRKTRPVLMVFEDMQWIDPTSRDLVDLIIDRIRRLPGRSKPEDAAPADAGPPDTSTLLPPQGPRLILR